MFERSPKSRREFLRCTGTTAIAGSIGVAAASNQTANGATSPSSKSNIRIGARINPLWLEGGDANLRFLKQIGVDAVDVELIMVDGYRDNGTITKTALRQLLDRIQGVGLKLERANALGPYINNAHLGLPDGQGEIDNLKQIGELLVDAGVPIFGIQAWQATQSAAAARSGWSRRQGRGGYDYPSFSLTESRTAAKPPKQRVTADQLWGGLLNIYRQVMPIVDGSKTRIAMHGNDPPLYDHLGNPQILCRFGDFDRLFREVPSANNGITFCVGTRYESGEDIFEGLRHFGGAGKLFHIHFRNVRGTLPGQQEYSEVFVDDGDINMTQVVRTLHEVGYDGVIDYDHPIGLDGDDPLHKQYISFVVGYMRSLIQSLTS